MESFLNEQYLKYPGTCRYHQDYSEYAVVNAARLGHLICLKRFLDHHVITDINIQGMAITAALINNQNEGWCATYLADLGFYIPELTILELALIGNWEGLETALLYMDDTTEEAKRIYNLAFTEAIRCNNYECIEVMYWSVCFNYTPDTAVQTAIHYGRLNILKLIIKEEDMAVTKDMIAMAQQQGDTQIINYLIEMMKE
jgi:hypothetical protein